VATAYKTRILQTVSGESFNALERILASTKLKKLRAILSRAHHGGTLFTDEISRLSLQLVGDFPKSSALDINQSVSIGQRLGMG